MPSTYYTDHFAKNILENPSSILWTFECGNVSFRFIVAVGMKPMV